MTETPEVSQNPSPKDFTQHEESKEEPHTLYTVTESLLDPNSGRTKSKRCKDKSWPTFSFVQCVSRAVLSYLHTVPTALHNTRTKSLCLATKGYPLSLDQGEDKQQVKSDTGWETGLDRWATGRRKRRKLCVLPEDRLLMTA